MEVGFGRCDKEEVFVSRELHSVERKEAEAGPQILSLKLTNICQITDLEKKIY